LILDNLETVKDTRIDAFLDRLPQGSKILITSRIGLGEFERRLRLDPLEEHDSIRLLQALARTRGLDVLQNAKRDLLGNWCRRMKNNPGFIKWFVSAVQAGQRPEQILDRPALFLDFCMSNVYGYLNPDSLVVLTILQVIAQPLSQAELAYLSDFDAQRLQKCLYQLTSTNMVRMGSFGTGSSAETKYSLAELARDYLTKHHPVALNTATRVRRQFREIHEAGFLTDQESKVNPFSYFSIVRRSRGELLISKYLVDALTQVSRKELNSAFDNIDKARALAPQFFEVHRVAAIAHAAAGNVQEAEESYIAAIELEPKSAPLRYWFGNFLARSMQDATRALDQYSAAEQLAPNEPQIVLERARCYMYLAKFSDARSATAPLMSDRRLPAGIMRKVADLRLQIELREAEHWFRQKDFARASEHMRDFVGMIASFPPHLLDKHTATTIKRAYFALGRASSAIVDVVLQREVENWKDLIARTLSGLGFHLFEGPERWNYGRIKNIVDGRFGFIQGDDGEDYYFGVHALKTSAAHTDNVVGRRVRFELGMNAQGVCAVNVGDDLLSDSKIPF
jgi:LuxR family transcriptional regulator, glucitol operon activator